MASASLLHDLRTRLGALDCLEGNDISRRYSCDWSGIGPCVPAAVLRPADVSDVAYIMRKCHEYGQPVVVQGGMTGLCSGATPQPGEIAISLEKLSGIENLDRDAMTMTVLAGTPLESIQIAAATEDLLFPLDLGARGSCTIGGNIATNAGGTEVIQFGMARSLVLGLEVVLPNGTIMSSMNAMLKNNAGFDIKHLFIGTEGTLGIITRAVVRLFPAPLSRSTALCEVGNVHDCIELLRELRKMLGNGLRSFEVMWPDYLQYILDNFPELAFPFERTDSLCVLAEYTGYHPDRDASLFEAALHGIMTSGLITNAVISQSERDAKNIWTLRESIAEVFQKLKNPISFDVSAPVRSLPGFRELVLQDLKSAFPNVITLTYGHLGDSNIHLTVATGLTEDLTKISNIVYRRIGEIRGSISGEHGIGVAKQAYLSFSRSREEIAFMHQLKSLIDPKDILNPNRVLPSSLERTGVEVACSD